MSLNKANTKWLTNCRSLKSAMHGESVLGERAYDGKRLNVHRVATTPMQNSRAAQNIPDSSTCLSATLAFKLRYKLELECPMS